MNLILIFSKHSENTCVETAIPNVNVARSFLVMPFSWIFDLFWKTCAYFFRGLTAVRRLKYVQKSLARKSNRNGPREWEQGQQHLYDYWFWKTSFSVRLNILALLCWLPFISYYTFRFRSNQIKIIFSFLFSIVFSVNYSLKSLPHMHTVEMASDHGVRMG